MCRIHPPSLHLVAHCLVFTDKWCSCDAVLANRLIDCLVFSLKTYFKKQFQAIDSDASLDETERNRRKQVRPSSLT